MKQRRPILPHLKRFTALGLGITVILGALAFRQADEDPFYYANGQKLYWQPQHDMYAFRTVGEGAFLEELDTAVVERIEFRSGYPDKLNLLFFKPNSSNWQRLQVIDDIEKSVQFSRSFPVVTMFDHSPADAGLWYVADDLIMVMFKNDTLRQAHIQRIKDEYNLTQVNDPSLLPEGGTYAYIFKWDIYDTTVVSGIDLSRYMYEQDSQVIWSVEPNFIRGYEPIGVDDSDTLLSSTQPSLHSEATAATLYMVMQGQSMANVYLKTTEPHFNFRMYDLFGRLLAERHLTSSDTKIDLNISHLSAGVYFGTLETLDGQPFATVKFAK